MSCEVHPVGSDPPYSTSDLAVTPVNRACAAATTRLLVTTMPTRTTLFIGTVSEPRTVQVAPSGDHAAVTAAPWRCSRSHRRDEVVVNAVLAVVLPAVRRRLNVNWFDADTTMDVCAAFAPSPWRTIRPASPPSPAVMPSTNATIVESPTMLR